MKLPGAMVCAQGLTISGLLGPGGPGGGCAVPDTGAAAKVRMMPARMPARVSDDANARMMPPMFVVTAALACYDRWSSWAGGALCTALVV